jgi:hypothetical protein
MAIQFLLVTFPDQRSVLADGNGVGFTNHILMLPAGEYLITLDGAGYSPASQDIALVGTSIVKPLVIAFNAAEVAAGVAAEAAGNETASGAQATSLPSAVVARPGPQGASVKSSASTVVKGRSRGA